ncbi:hypothetical protein Bbelb_317210 [Branchiostoma belcheri]|nr:hypothetical protein Bbelb_317210 [Branchiostoma belcheri]
MPDFHTRVDAFRTAFRPLVDATPKEHIGMPFGQKDEASRKITHSFMERVLGSTRRDFPFAFKQMRGIICFTDVPILVLAASADKPSRERVISLPNMQGARRTQVSPNRTNFSDYS